MLWSLELPGNTKIQTNRRHLWASHTLTSTVVPVAPCRASLRLTPLILGPPHVQSEIGVIIMHLPPARLPSMRQAIAASFFLLAITPAADTAQHWQCCSTHRILTPVTTLEYGFSTPPAMAVMCFSNLVLLGQVGQKSRILNKPSIIKRPIVEEIFCKHCGQTTKKHQSIMTTITSRCFLSQSDVWLLTNFLPHRTHQRTPERREWIEYATLSSLDPRSLPSDKPTSG